MIAASYVTPSFPWWQHLYLCHKGGLGRIYSTSIEQLTLENPSRPPFMAQIQMLPLVKGRSGIGGD